MTAEIYGRVGATIRDRRQALGLSQAQLAERAGLVRTSVTMIERGAQAVLVHQLVELAEALRTDPSELLSRSLVAPTAEVIQADQAEIEHLLTGLDRAVGRITRS